MLDPFLIDVYEMTNAQFTTFLNTPEVTAKCVVRVGELRPDGVEGPDVDRFTPEPGFANHPASESTWQGAVAFCAWRGARLPTEAEWEAAARGNEGRAYPWGEAPPTSERAVFGRGRGETDPVGSHLKGARPEGVFDLAGNEAEWTSSLFKPYPYDAADSREDPKAPGERVTRGDDHMFDVAPNQLTGYFRDGFSRNPRRGHRHIGFTVCEGCGIEFRPLYSSRS
jgi:iron(II)-dependent oxidoreductase